VANSKKKSTLEEKTGYISTLMHWVQQNMYVTKKDAKIQWISSSHVLFINNICPYFCVANVMKNGSILF